jgi:hypothetical protein
MIPSCKFEVDCSATELGTAGSHGRYKRVSYAVTTAAFSDVDVT